MHVQETRYAVRDSKESERNENKVLNPKRVYLMFSAFLHVTTHIGALKSLLHFFW